jgi:hypothetical protein
MQPERKPLVVYETAMRRALLAAGVVPYNPKAGIKRTPEWTVTRRIKDR